MKNSRIIVLIAFLVVVITIVTLVFTADANPLNTSAYVDERTDDRYVLNEQQKSGNQDEEQGEEETQSDDVSTRLVAGETDAVLASDQVPAEGSTTKEYPGLNTHAENQNSGAKVAEQPQDPASPPAHYADRRTPLSYLFGKLSELV